MRRFLVSATMVAYLPLALLSGLVLIQPVQWAVMAYLYEPYPTLAFPMFQGGGRAIDEPAPPRQEPTFTAHWDTGDQIEVPRADLFRPIPEPSRWAVILLNFGPDRLAEMDTRTRLPMSRWPGRQQLWRNVGNPARARAGASWLQSRLVALYPAHRATAITIRWPDASTTIAFTP